MPTQYEQATTFANLHIKGTPLILYNIWDTGSAKAVQDAGAKAIATGSASVAFAHGYNDEEDMPFELVLGNLRQIVARVHLPVTLDFEGGYAQTLEALQQNIAQVIAAGAIGINFEDQIVGGEGLYPIEEQSKRIAAVRQAADQASIPLFINARTDIFLKANASTHSEVHLQDAIARSIAYAQAGASGFFAPGLKNIGFIETLCAASQLPVNVMYLPDAPSTPELASVGVARVSYGPYPYRQTMQTLMETAQKVYS